MSGRHAWLGSLAVAAIAFGIFATYAVETAMLADTDSYFHLAVARLYAESGVVDELAWARFSIMHQGYGDKEVLFHLLLAPFTDGFDTGGGRWALALLAALLCGVLAELGRRAVGPWGWLTPAAAVLGTELVLLRVVRLRPELLGVTLLLLAAWLAGRGRVRLLGLVSFLYTLAYTAFHALLGLCVLWWLAEWWATGRRRWGLVSWPTLGAVVALVVHPHFPHNVGVWMVQSIEFFRHKAQLDVGQEIEPTTTAVLLQGNVGWLAALVVLLAVAGGARRRRHELDGPARAFTVAAVVFGVLAMLMGRFHLYALPMILLAVLFQRGRRSGLGTRVALPWRGHLPAAPVLAAVALLSVAFGVHTLHRLVETADPHFERNARTLGEAVPDGARIATPWGPAQHFVFFAPQGRYLNVLDPVFMALPHPDAYRARRRVWSGEEPDVPRTVAGVLRSTHLAGIGLGLAPAFARRLGGDPRLRPVAVGEQWLYAVEPSAAFVRDWRLVPKGNAIPVAAATQVDGWPAWPRESGPLAEIEGFVDLHRFGPADDCRAVVHRWREASAVEVRWQLAPWGATWLWLDDEMLVELPAGGGAVLGEGPLVTARLSPGEHRLTVLSCPAEGRAGFYLLERDRW